MDKDTDSSIKACRKRSGVETTRASPQLKIMVLVGDSDNFDTCLKRNLLGCK